MNSSEAQVVAPKSPRIMHQRRQKAISQIPPLSTFHITFHPEGTSISNVIYLKHKHKRSGTFAALPASGSFFSGLIYFLLIRLISFPPPQPTSGYGINNPNNEVGGAERRETTIFPGVLGRKKPRWLLS